MYSFWPPAYSIYSPVKDDDRQMRRNQYDRCSSGELGLWQFPEFRGSLLGRMERRGKRQVMHSEAFVGTWLAIFNMWRHEMWGIERDEKGRVGIQTHGLCVLVLPFTV